MFNKHYQELTTEEKMELLSWELETLAIKNNDEEIGILATKIKLKFWERKFGTTLEDFISKNNEKKGKE